MMSDYMEDVLSDSWVEYSYDADCLVSECELTDEDYLDDPMEG